MSDLTGFGSDAMQPSSAQNLSRLQIHFSGGTSYARTNAADTIPGTPTQY